MWWYVGWAGAVVVCNCIAAWIARDRATRLLARPFEALPDLLQHHLPRLTTHTPDYVLLACLCVVASHYYAVEERHVKALLQTLSLRPIFVVCTTLPSCMTEQRHASSSIYSKLFLSSHDLMFSGHTAIFQFCGVVLGGPLGQVMRYLLPFVLVAGRQHYTMDVLVAIAIFHAVF